MINTETEINELEYFIQKLREMSKIPLKYFENNELQGSNLANEEKKFSEYIKRKCNNESTRVKKPVRSNGLCQREK